VELRLSRDHESFLGGDRDRTTSQGVGGIEERDRDSDRSSLRGQSAKAWHKAFNLDL
jgi:hypothetical protein